MFGAVAHHRGRFVGFAAGCVLVSALIAASTVPPTGAGAAFTRKADSVTPIKHVIVIIGENHTFDNVFATYRPPKGQSVRNLLSEGIVTATGAPGPNVGVALQRTASDTTADGYQVSPRRTGSYTTLPQPDTTYAQGAAAECARRPVPGQPAKRPVPGRRGAADRR